MPDTARVAIVTGAARGIGAACARRLAGDGHAVAVLDLAEDACRPVVDEITGAGGRAVAVAVDVADEESVQGAAARVAGELGAPTVLVNNAGILRDNLLFRTSALGNRGQSNYSAAKAGMQGLTKTLAIELGPFGVTVNAVAPGFVETAMTEATAARLGMSFADFAAAVVTQVPVGRVGTPDDIAAAVSFFVRAEAAYVSGQVLYVAGGPRA